MKLNSGVDKICRARNRRLAPPRVVIVSLVEPGAIAECVAWAWASSTQPCAALGFVAVGSGSGLLGRVGL